MLLFAELFKFRFIFTNGWRWADMGTKQGPFHQTVVHNGSAVSGMTLLMMTFFCVQSEEMFYTGNEKFLHTVRFMIVILLYNLGIVVLNATFNNISVVWWLSVLLVEKKRRITSSCCQILSHYVSSTSSRERSSKSQL